jgi:hypothetical protein
MGAGIEATDELAEFLTDLHDSEINGEIGWFFDGVWCVKSAMRTMAIKPRPRLCR